MPHEEEKFKDAVKRDVEARVREGVKAVLEEVLEEEMAEHLKAGYRELSPTRKGFLRSLRLPTAGSTSMTSTVIEGTILLMSSSEIRLVNVGNPTEYSVREIANLILSLSHSESSLIHKPLPEEDPKQRCSDISRAREALNWEPQVSAKEGLDLTIRWFAKRRADVTLQR